MECPIKLTVRAGGFMDFGQRIETTLQIALCRATESECPPQLAAALRHAVFPGGARVRPRLCLAVAHACGDGEPALADSAAAAIELMHCASLVHDDLPCFDDADTRRGRPSVHKAFGQPLAVLTGDALIVASFALLGRSIPSSPARAGGLISLIAAAVGGADRHRCRPGLGMRGRDSPGPLSQGQNGVSVRRCHRRWSSRLWR